MKRALLSVTFLTAAALARAGGVDWITDYGKGVESAKQSGKLIQVHFTADW